MNNPNNKQDNPFLLFLEAYRQFLSNWKATNKLLSFCSPEAFKIKFKNDNNEFVKRAKDRYNLSEDKVKRYLEFN